MGEKEPRSKVSKRVPQPPHSDHFNNIPGVFYPAPSFIPCPPSCAHRSHSAAGRKSPSTTASSTRLLGGPGTRSYTNASRAGGEKEQQDSCAMSRRDALRQDAEVAGESAVAYALCMLVAIALVRCGHSGDYETNCRVS